MKTSELVAKGRDELAKGWVQGSYGDGRGVCAVGALRKVLTGSCSGSVAWEPHSHDRLFNDAFNELSIKTVEMFNFTSVIAFNDEKTTTKQDMLDLFDKTIIGLEEKGL